MKASGTQLTTSNAADDINQHIREGHYESSLVKAQVQGGALDD